MIRLAIATVVLAVALVLVRRRQRRAPGSETLRVSSRTGISRGVLAAVLEVEERRFLVTITASSTTLVAELGSVPGLAPGSPSELPVPVAEHAVAEHTVTRRPVTERPVAVGASVVSSVAPAAGTSRTAETADAGSFLERIRARTVRTFDAELAARAGSGS